MTVKESDTVQMEQEDTGAAAPAGPGRRLREARETAGLSREEVSTRLRLRLELIRALEEDDYAHLPPTAFVIGYLRSYARLLDLSADELLAMLDRRGEAPVLVSQVMPPHQRHSGDWPVKLATWLIVLLLTALLVAWWFARQPLEHESVAEVPVLTPGSTVDLPLPPAEEQTRAEAPPAVVEETPVVSAPPVAAPVLLAEIQLEATHGECWVEIKDAGGNQVAYELLQAGMTRTVRGRAPFDVFLGNAPAVTVYYQGQVFDHTPFHRREVAKFRLGKAADNKPLAE
jgi:cytoskeleton protein RodZ